MNIALELFFKFSFNFQMSFFPHEIELLKKAFPFKTADLESDFDQEELEAIENIGVLKGNPHYYLGIFYYFISHILQPRCN